MFLLHVGPHKTATTWLQQNFHHNIKALEAAGWYYPRTGERVRVAHHDLSDNPAEILDPASRKVQELRAIAERSRERGLNVLLSSEGFRNWKPAHLKALQAIMAPHEMHIVYCLRDPASLLYSFWAQQVKTGQTRSFDRFRRIHLRSMGKSKIVNPLVEVNVLAKIEGVSLTLLAYDEIRRQGRDIFDVFVADILKIAALPHADDASGNERQPLEMTEFMRLVQLRTGSWKDDADANIGQAFRFLMPERTRETIVAAVGAVADARRTVSIDRDMSRFVRIQKRLLNRYAGLIVPKPLGGRLFLSGSLDCTYYDSADLEADPTVRRLLDEVAGQFRPGGLRLWIMGWSRFWLTRWRRFIKLFRH